PPTVAEALAARREDSPVKFYHAAGRVFESRGSQPIRMTPFQLRPATAADLPRIVAMRDQLNALELAGCPHASIQKLSVEQFASLWGPTLTKPDYCWRVIESDGQVIGYGLIFLNQPRTTPPSAYVQWAYLDPAHRRRGMGE